MRRAIGVGAGMVATAAAALALLPGQAAAEPPTDFWLGKEFMNMAHQGGELEAPGNTLYAFKTAVKYRGADTLEMDCYLTLDGRIVVTHDMSPSGTSDAPSGITVANSTLAELRQYDFAYKFSPGKGHYRYSESDPHPLRGIATGDRPVPPGFNRDDFRIATFEQVLDAFPDTPINIDMKAPGEAPQYATATAEKMAEILNRPEYADRSEDVIVASFFSGALERFHELAPGHKALSASEASLLGYIGDTPITPEPVALQPPDLYDLGGPEPVRTVPILRPLADRDGYAIHVWGSDLDPEQETAPFYQRLIDEGADGFFTQRPSHLHQFLCESGVPRPDGSPRCASQEPEPEARLRVHRVRGPKRIKAGRKATLEVLLQNVGDGDMRRVRVCAKVSRRTARTVKVPPCKRVRNLIPGQIAYPKLRLRTTRRARGGHVVRVVVRSANAGSEAIRHKLKIKRRR